MHWEDLEGSGGEGGGRGIGMGNTCKSMADSFQCMTKNTTIKNKNKKNQIYKSFQLSADKIKIWQSESQLLP